MSSFQHQALRRQVAERWESRTRTASCWKGKKRGRDRTIQLMVLRFKKKNYKHSISLPIHWRFWWRVLIHTTVWTLECEVQAPVPGFTSPPVRPSCLNVTAKPSIDLDNKLVYVPLDLAIVLYFLGGKIAHANAKSLMHVKLTLMRLLSGILATKTWCELWDFWDQYLLCFVWMFFFQRVAVHGPH